MFFWIIYQNYISMNYQFHYFQLIYRSLEIIQIGAYLSARVTLHMTNNQCVTERQAWQFIFIVNRSIFLPSSPRSSFYPFR